MPRMLRRAAVLGATAHVAHNRGEASAQQEAAQQAAAQPAAAPPAPAQDPYETLEKNKKLLDQGILTQAEFDAQKAKILGQM